MEHKLGVVGLGVMGGNLALNAERNGFPVVGYDLDAAKTRGFVEGPGAGKQVSGAESPAALMAALEKPRRVLVMVPAGAAVDSAIAHLKPHLERGDILIDGGNSWFLDTERRSKALAADGFHFVGMGVSGGEEGALWGPSMMPGGQREAYDALAPILLAMAAKADDGVPCVEHMGPLGAGHYVKMVHNGIEYGDMQLIAESYHLMKEGLGLGADELKTVYDKWNRGRLDSFLIEITRDIMGVKDEDGSPLLDKILDAAGQKGTGKWTSNSALDLGMPVTLIGEAVFSRALSALKDERVRASEKIKGPSSSFSGEKQRFIDDVENALYASKIVSYAQGYMLLREASKEYGWSLNFGSIALMWRGGCIIRSRFLGDIKKAFDKNPELENLLLDEFFQKAMAEAHEGWRRTVSSAALLGIPTPAMSSALAFFDGYRRARLPANLLQAQRDYFGAHTYERTDKPRGEFFHTNWTGRGGHVSSRTYNA
jgi:6-phosphogluconate dehydrogenase